jgi:hypothetical protein
MTEITLSLAYVDEDRIYIKLFQLNEYLAEISDAEF